MVVVVGGWELLRALEPVHPGTVNQWTNENLFYLFAYVTDRYFSPQGTVVVYVCVYPF